MEGRRVGENECVCHMQESCVLRVYPNHLGPLIVVGLFRIPCE